MRSFALVCAVALVACSSDDTRQAPRSDTLRALTRWAPWTERSLTPRDGWLQPESLRAGFDVRLPTRSTSAVSLRVPNGGLRITPAGIEDVAAEIVDNAAVYHLGAHSDVVYLAHGKTFEDLRILHRATDRVLSRYLIELEGAITEIRSVQGDRLEAVDASGRVILGTSQAFVVDALGERRVATLRVLHDQTWVMEVSADTRGMKPPIVVDPAWSSVAPLNAAHFNAPIVSVPGGALVAGSGSTIDSRQWYEIYKESTNTWSSYNLAQSRLNHTLTDLGGGKVLVAGGWGGTAYETKVEIIDAAAGPTSLVAPMHHARAEHVAVKLASGKILVAGGYDAITPSLSPVSTAELYDPTSNTWTDTASLPVATYDLLATALPSGKVLAVGGNTATTTSKQAFVYEPVTATWSTVATMTTAHTFGGIVVLPSGKVLVFGGADTTGAVGSTAEIYDPLTDTWTPTASMKAARQQFAFGQSGSTVLAAGGYASGNLSTVEIFDATTLTWSDGPPMSERRSSTSGAWLPSGRFLVHTGIGYTPDGSGQLKTAEALDTAKSCATSTECASTEHCDGGLCKPKLTLGKSCSSTSDCTSGFCSDGVCCDKACAGNCEACSAAAKGTGSDGTCGNVAAGTDPRSKCMIDAGYPTSCKADGMCDGAGACRTFATSTTPCAATTCTSGSVSGSLCDGAGTCKSSSAVPCDPFLCNVGGTACRTSCTSNADCVATAFCTGGVCVAKLANGKSCTAGSQCGSSNCVDGVCCSSACAGSCEACTAALKGSGMDGVCGNVPEGTDPRSKCAPDPGFPANCKADGACDGLGACRVNAKAGTACGDATCTDGKVAGKLCDGAGVCATGSSSTCGAYKCDPGGKTCLTACTMDSDCAAGFVCGTTSTCVTMGSEKKADGATCSAAIDCTSGNCVDGVCCNVPCDGQCQACDVTGKLGVCSIVAGAPHGARSSCGDGVCAGKCDGVDSQHCVFPPAETSCGSTCSTGAVTSRVCKAGACVDGSSVSCSGYTCTGDVCATSCTDDLGCTGGYSCSDGVCAAAGPPVEVVSGCGCALPGNHRTTAGLAALGLIVAVVARRRRAVGAHGPR